MKAAVVTFVRAYNYGAVMQCYALCKTLQKLGIKTEALDYYPDYFENQYNLSYLGRMRYFPYRPLGNWLKFTPLLYLLQKRNKGFERFIKENIPLTQKQYRTPSEVCNETFDHDLYISGSDQVWSDWIACFDPVYFLDFPSAEKALKSSYAASFGFSTLPCEKKEEYKRRLKGWMSYSVREESAVVILKNLLGVNATQCCDPTLLLTKDEWGNIKQCTRQKPYIFLYSVNGCEALYKYAMELSREKKMDVIYVPCILKHEQMLGNAVSQYKFKTMSAVSPNEWIGLFANASYVITDSFHGTVFSVIFQRKFKTIARLYGEVMNNRAIELLGLLGLSDRIIYENFGDIDADINWCEVDKKLKPIREYATSFLSKLKEDVKNATN